MLSQHISLVSVKLKLLDLKRFIILTWFIYVVKEDKAEVIRKILGLRILYKTKVAHFTRKTYIGLT